MRPFDPASIPRYTVISLPFQFPESPHRISKFFVVLGHLNNHAICIKATSQVDVYLNNKEQKAGCVFYPHGECSYFHEDTAIQPDNQIPIQHALLQESHRRSELEIKGTLPSEFEKQLIKAVQESVTISPREKKRILQIINDPQ